MKIVNIITCSEPIGGAQVHVMDLSKALAQDGHDVTVMVGTEGLFTSTLRAAGIRCEIVPDLIRPLNLIKDFKAFREIRAQLKSLEPDLVTTHSSKAGWLGRLAGRSLGIPTFFTAHGWAFTEGVPPLHRRIYSLLERMAAPLAARIITVSEYDRNLAITYKVASPQKVVVIHNGVADSSRRANPDAESPRLVMVARFQAQKDHATLFKALASLTSLNWTLDLIGDGPLRQKAETMVAELNLSSRVRFWGQWDDVESVLAECQVFLLITNWEGFPLSILEAMRAGLPVVASEVGGVHEAVENGVTGFLISRGDASMLAERLAELLRNPELRRSMGENGRRSFTQRFTLELMLKQNLDVYSEALTKRQL